jgi:GNAT superfamily N-acetyltransferase
LECRNSSLLIHNYVPDSSPDKQHAQSGGTYRDPLALIDWPQLRVPGLWLPQTALSLHGLQEFDAIGAEVQNKLSQYEFINVMYCGLWLESIFLQRVSRLLRPGMPRTDHAHLLRELREETGHSLMFLRAIEASGVALPEGSWRARRVPAMLGRFAPAGGALFWLAMLIGEHVSDSFNRYVCEARDGVNPAIRQICAVHVEDEARHIGHARHMLTAALSTAGAVQRTVLSAAARVLLHQMTSAFYFPPVRFYALAGLANGIDWFARTQRNVVHKQFVAQRLAPTLSLLQSFGLNVVSPSMLKNINKKK